MKIGVLPEEFMCRLPVTLAFGGLLHTYSDVVSLTLSMCDLGSFYSPSALSVVSNLPNVLFSGPRADKFFFLRVKIADMRKDKKFP